MPRCRHALRNARTRPSSPRTTTSGFPAALRATYEPASGSAADGQNGTGSRSSSSSSAPNRCSQRVVRHRLAPGFGADIGGFVVDVVEYALATTRWSSSSASIEFSETRRSRGAAVMIHPGRDGPATIALFGPQRRTRTQQLLALTRHSPCTFRARFFTHVAIKPVLSNPSVRLNVSLDVQQHRLSTGQNRGQAKRAQALPQHRHHRAHRRGQDDDHRARAVLHRQEAPDHRGARHQRRQGQHHHRLPRTGTQARHHDPERRGIRPSGRAIRSTSSTRPDTSTSRSK